MKAPLLVLDCHYLCHRAFHVHKNLEWNGVASGVVFGFLKTILTLKKEFQTDRIAFCFEGRNLLRKKIYPEYKAKRVREYSPEETEARGDLHRQIQKLAKDYLPRIGFRNIFQYDGYESDDVMAQICLHLASIGSPRQIILVTSDSDMYQCLSDTVSIYDPVKQTIRDDHWFRAKYGIRPFKWAFVKSLCGCKTDNVSGIGGVGEMTAVMLVKERLGRKQRMGLTKTQLAVAARNSRLVELPFENCPIPRIVPDEISEKGWHKVCKQLGMDSIRHQLPIYRINRGIPKKR